MNQKTQALAPIQEFKIVLEENAERIKKIIPSHLDKEQVLENALILFERSEAAQKCTPQSVVTACIDAAKEGLEIKTGAGFSEAYAIPRKNKLTGKMEAHYQRGYMGDIKLAQNTGLYKIIISKPVYKGDVFEHESGLNVRLVHKPGKQEGSPIGYYCAYKLTNGEQDYVYMTTEQCLDFMYKWNDSWEYNKAKGEYTLDKNGRKIPSGIWAKDFDSACLKTVVKKALKYAPKSVQKTVIEDFANPNYGFRAESPYATSDVIDVEGKKVNSETGEVLQ
jgi:recombination protein RecT